MTALAISAPPATPWRRIRKVADAAVWTVLALIILAAGTLGVYVHTGHGAVSPVLTGSMRPGIQPGDAVATRSVPVSTLHVGDIIVFTPPHASIAKVHRIHSLAKEPTGILITTKGDANNAVDPWGHILLKGSAYKVAFVVPHVGWLVDGGLRWVITGLVIVFGLIISRWTWKYVRS